MESKGGMCDTSFGSGRGAGVTGKEVVVMGGMRPVEGVRATGGNAPNAPYLQGPILETVDAGCRHAFRRRRHLAGGHGHQREGAEEAEHGCTT